MVDILKGGCGNISSPMFSPQGQYDCNFLSSFNNIEYLNNQSSDTDGVIRARSVLLAEVCSRVVDYN